ncbi:MAG: hypothetical protein V7735_21415 [Photobacterium frigidiphilum]|uniref:hypothetical protein n=1 Tax=Photobacterium frigidiphilum TaxID=264736 RepID=UPI0030037FE5
MKNVVIAATVTTLISGCTTMFQGSEQVVNVRTIEDAAQHATECTLTNEEGVWYSDSRDSVQIHRDGNALTIECDNGLQDGKTMVDPRFQVEWLVADFFWDLCIFTMSCVIDGANNSFYEYPTSVSVPMEYKAPTNSQILTK